jgi:hypothetical protein
LKIEFRDEAHKQVTDHGERECMAAGVDPWDPLGQLGLFSGSGPEGHKTTSKSTKHNTIPNQPNQTNTTRTMQRRVYGNNGEGWEQTDNSDVYTMTHTHTHTETLAYVGLGRQDRQQFAWVTQRKCFHKWRWAGLGGALAVHVGVVSPS